MRSFVENEEQNKLRCNFIDEDAFEPEIEVVKFFFHRFTLIKDIVYIVLIIQCLWR